MNLKLLLIYLVAFFVYTQGYWERFTPIPAKGILEILVLLLTILYFRPKNKKSVLLFLAVIGVGLFSAINTGTIVNFFKHVRFLFYSYVLIDVVQHCRLSIPQFRRLLSFFVFMVLLQGIAAVFQVFILHDRVEGYVGMMSSLGGTTATAFPVMIISLTTVVFCFARTSNRKWYRLMILIVLSMFLVGYSSGKRAIYISIPSFAILGMIVSYIIARNNGIKLRRSKIYTFIVIGLMCVPLFFYGVTNSSGYSNQLTGNETKNEILITMLEFAQFYETAEMDGETVGRSNTTGRLLTVALTDKHFFLFGDGFLADKDEDAVSQRGVGYGFVGFTRDLFTGGIIYSILTIIFLFHLILRKDYEINDAFSKTLRAMLVLVFIFIHFFYSPDFTLSLRLTCVLALVLSFVNSCNYYHIKVYLESHKWVYAKVGRINRRSVLARNTENGYSSK